MLSIPKEVCTHFISFLQETDVVNFSLVSRAVNTLCEPFWAEILHKQQLPMKMEKSAKEQVSTFYKRYCHFFYETLKLEKPKGLSLFEHNKHIDFCISSEKKVLDEAITKIFQELEQCNQEALRDDLKRKLELLLIAGAKVQPVVDQDPCFFCALVWILDSVNIALNAKCSETSMRWIVQQASVKFQHVKNAIMNGSSEEIIFLLIENLREPLSTECLENVYGASRK